MHKSRADYKSVSRASPCPICGKPDNCSVHVDGNSVWCGREKSEKINRGGQSLFVLDEHGRFQPFSVSHPVRSYRKSTPRRQPTPARDNRADIVKATAFYLSCGPHAVPAEMINAAIPTCGPTTEAAWAKELGVPVDGLRTMEVRYGSAVTPRTNSDTNEREQVNLTFLVYPERSNNGFCRRYSHDVKNRKGDFVRKVHELGTPRGVTVRTVDATSNVMHCVEGLTDAAVLAGAGLNAASRPNNVMGGNDLATILENTETLVIWGENDRKPNGRWPGKEGAEQVARDYCNRTLRPCQIKMPPAKHKDIRDAWAWYCKRSKMDPANPTATDQQRFRRWLLSHEECVSEFRLAADHLRVDRFDKSLEEINLAIELLKLEGFECGIEIQLGIPRKDIDGVGNGLFEWIMGRVRCHQTNSCPYCAPNRELTFARDLANHLQDETVLYRHAVDEATAIRIIRKAQTMEDRGCYAWCRTSDSQRIVWTNYPFGDAVPLDAYTSLGQLLRDAQSSTRSCSRRLGTCRKWKTTHESSDSVFLHKGDLVAVQQVVNEWNLSGEELEIKTKQIHGSAFVEITQIGLVAELPVLKQFAGHVRERDNVLRGLHPPE